jgi:hypothetical protein
MAIAGLSFRSCLLGLIFVVVAHVAAASDIPEAMKSIIAPMYALPPEGKAFSFTLDVTVTHEDGKTEQETVTIMRDSHVVYIRFERPKHMRDNELLLRGNVIFEYRHAGPEKHRVGATQNFASLHIVRYIQELLEDPYDDYEFVDSEKRATTFEGRPATHYRFHELSTSDVFEYVDVVVDDSSGLARQAIFTSVEDGKVWRVGYTYGHVLALPNGVTQSFPSRVDVEELKEGLSATLTYGTPELIDDSMVPRVAR